MLKRALSQANEVKEIEVTGTGKDLGVRKMQCALFTNESAENQRR